MTAGIRTGRGGGLINDENSQDAMRLQVIFSSGVVFVHHYRALHTAGEEQRRLCDLAFNNLCKHLYRRGKFRAAYVIPAGFPPSPSTGDSLHIAPYLAVMLFSLATVAVLFGLRRKRNDMIHENQKRRTERTKQ